MLFHFHIVHHRLLFFFHGPFSSLAYLILYIYPLSISNACKIDNAIADGLWSHRYWQVLNAENFFSINGRATAFIQSCTWELTQSGWILVLKERNRKLLWNIFVVSIIIISVCRSPILSIAFCLRSDINTHTVIIVQKIANANKINLIKSSSSSKTITRSTLNGWYRCPFIHKKLKFNTSVNKENTQTKTKFFARIKKSKKKKKQKRRVSN